MYQELARHPSLISLKAFQLHEIISSASLVMNGVVNNPDKSQLKKRDNGRSFKTQN